MLSLNFEQEVAGSRPDLSICVCACIYRRVSRVRQAALCSCHCDQLLHLCNSATTDTVFSREKIYRLRGMICRETRKHLVEGSAQMAPMNVCRHFYSRSFPNNYSHLDRQAFLWSWHPENNTASYDI